MTAWVNTTVFAAGFALLPNGERHLRRPTNWPRRYPPALLAETWEGRGALPFLA